MKMLEQIAINLYNEDKDKRNAIFTPWEKLREDKFNKPYFRMLARLALETLREPSEELIDAALRSTAVHHDIKGSALTVNREKMKLRLNALIDAALKE